MHVDTTAQCVCLSLCMHCMSVCMYLCVCQCVHTCMHMSSEFDHSKLDELRSLICLSNIYFICN